MWTFSSGFVCARSRKDYGKHSRKRRADVFIHATFLLRKRHSMRRAKDGPCAALFCLSLFLQVAALWTKIDSELLYCTPIRWWLIYSARLQFMSGLCQMVPSMTICPVTDTGAKLSQNGCTHHWHLAARPSAVGTETTRPLHMGKGEIWESKWQLEDLCVWIQTWNMFKAESVSK